MKDRASKYELHEIRVHKKVAKQFRVALRKFLADYAKTTGCRVIDK